MNDIPSIELSLSIADNAAALVDHEVLEDLAGQIGKDNLAIVLQKFLAEAKRRWAALEEANSQQELAREAHAKLLRFLETGEFYHVGGTKKLQRQTRVVSATNKDLDRMIEKVLIPLHEDHVAPRFDLVTDALVVAYGPGGEVLEERTPE